MSNVLIVLLLLVVVASGAFSIKERSDCKRGGGAYVVALEWPGYACVERNK